MFENLCYENRISKKTIKKSVKYSKVKQEHQCGQQLGKQKQLGKRKEAMKRKMQCSTKHKKPYISIKQTARVMKIYCKNRQET